MAKKEARDSALSVTEASKLLELLPVKASLAAHPCSNPMDGTLPHHAVPADISTIWKLQKLNSCLRFFDNT